MTYPAGTVGWLKYERSETWFRVEVLSRHPGTNSYEVRRSRTSFNVDGRDVLIVVAPST
jgi:hypothetical protein